MTQAVWDLLMSLPSQCELVRRVRETALAASDDAPEKPEEPSAMEEEPNADEGREEEDGVEGSTAAPVTSEEVVKEGVSGAEDVDKTEVQGGDGGSGTSGVASTEKAWVELLPVGRSWHKTVYTLQIIDALLLPAEVGACWSCICLLFILCLARRGARCFWSSGYVVLRRAECMKFVDCS